MDFNDSFIKTKYKVLVHSLNFANPEAQDVFGINQNTTNTLISDKQNPIQYHDAVDYLNVHSPLHWKKLEANIGNTAAQVEANQTKYRTEWKKAFFDFKNTLINMIKNDYTVSENASGSRLAVQKGSFSDIISKDITDQIKTITGYNNNLNDFTNTIGFVLNMNGVLEGQYYNGLNHTSNNIKDFITENQIIEVRAQREGDTQYYTEYIGFIGTITYEKKHGNVNSLSITTYGLHKLLSLSSVVSKQAIYQMFEEGVEINASGVPLFQDNWNNLNVYEIFKEVLGSVLSLKPFNVGTGLTDADASIKALETEVSVMMATRLSLSSQAAELVAAGAQAGNPLNLQTSVWKVKQKSLAEVEELIRKKDAEILAKNAEIGTAQTLYNDKYKSIRGTLTQILFSFDNKSMTDINSFRTSFITIYLYYLVRMKCKDESTYKINFENRNFKPSAADTMAAIEHGDHQAFNKMVATGYAKWYSEMTMPIDVLKSIRESAMYDIFEERHGYIVCRPPRYNDMYLELPSIQTKDSIPDSPSPSTSGDFVIPYYRIMDMNYSKNDIEMLTRCDTKNMWPFLGEVQYIGSNYCDPNLLVKYGLRVNQPQTNPNVGEPQAGAIFSALSLYKQNMFTRQVSISVPNDRDYFVGNTYYIQMSEDFNEEYVGYLISSEIVFGYNGVSKTILKFGAIRKIIREDSTNKFSSEQYDMFFSIYRDKIYEYVSSVTGSTVELYKNEHRSSVRIQRATQYVEHLRKTNKVIMYFSVIPTIMDIIYYVENNPTIPDKTNPPFPTEAEIKGWVKKNQLVTAKDFSGRYLYVSNYPYGAAISQNITPTDSIPYVDIYGIGTSLSVRMAYLPKKDINSTSLYLQLSDYPGNTVAVSSKDLVVITPFKKGIFDSKVSKSDSFVDQRLINTLTMIDLSFKNYNYLIDDVPGSKLSFATNLDRLNYLDSLFGMVPSGPFSYNKLTDYAYDILFYKYDSPDLKSLWYSVENIDSSSSFAPPLVMIPSNGTRRSYFIPKCEVYSSNVTGLLGIHAYKKLFNLDGGQYVFTKTIVPTGIMNLDEQTLLTIHKYNTISGALELIASDIAMYGTNNKQQVDLAFVLDNGIIDMDKLLNKGTGNFNSVMWGFRLPGECSQIAVDAGKPGSSDSQDPHYKGLALAFDTFNLRTANNGRLNLTQDFYTTFDKVFKLLFEKQYLTKYDPAIITTYDPNIIMNVRRNPAKFPPSDTLYYLEV